MAFPLFALTHLTETIVDGKITYTSRLKQYKLS